MASLPEGNSGYFSAPSHGLDPSLFDAEHLKPGVRSWLWRTISEFLSDDMHMHYANKWLHVWLAGSGVTYQWDADRGNGDLDVLIGVSFKNFSKVNPQYKDLPEESIAQWLNQEMKAHLWPKTAHEDINGRVYEVTFYWNPGVENDITVINPYAAYNVMDDKWKVRPPQLPSNPSSLYSDDFRNAAIADLNQATDIYTAYYQNGGSPRYAELAKGLLEGIHGGRKAAFEPGGKGYGDWANFRWQSAKQSGVIAGLTEVVKHSQGDGPAPDGADILLTRAMLRYQSDRYDR